MKSEKVWKILLLPFSISLLWGYTRDEEGKSFADAKRIHDELLWYAAANNRIQGDGSNATDEPTEPFVPKRPGEWRQ